MEYRIRYREPDTVIVEKGVRISQKPNPFGPGYIMPGFRVYEMRTFSSLIEAVNYIKKTEKNDVKADIEAYGNALEFIHKELHRLRYSLAENNTYVKERVSLKIL